MLLSKPTLAGFNLTKTGFSLAMPKMLDSFATRDVNQQRTKARLFRDLHQGGKILLPNAWDVAGALIFGQAGFAAIAITSAGIAYTLGYPDGQKISRRQMLTSVARIAEKGEGTGYRRRRSRQHLGW